MYYFVRVLGSKGSCGKQNGLTIEFVSATALEPTA